jgi:hypothetical protein
VREFVQLKRKGHVDVLLGVRRPARRDAADYYRGLIANSALGESRSRRVSA